MLVLIRGPSRAAGIKFSKHSAAAGPVFENLIQKLISDSKSGVLTNVNTNTKKEKSDEPVECDSP